LRHSVRTSVAAVAALVAATASAVVPASATASPPPGITATQVSLGAIVTQSGSLAADFQPYLYGEQSYFNYVNSSGGVFGRHLVLTHALDDQSNPTNDTTDARNLVTADHVFAIVGVATALFNGGASYLKTTATPTFGYATSNIWSGPKNFFADYGSVVNYNSSVPDFAYVAKQVKGTKLALIALNYPSSQDECQPAVKQLKSSYGVNVAYSNLNEPIFDANFSTDVTKMRSAGVNMVISCMDVGGDIALSKAMQLQGFTNVPQLWLDGYDRNVLKSNAPFMDNVYFMVQHVPFEAAATYTTKYPGLNLYFDQMAKSGYGSSEFSDVALMGWESAELFTQGLRAAGKNPTQAAVNAAINKIKNDTGGGVAAPTDWTVAHTKATSPSCVAFVATKGTSGSNPSFTQVFNHGANPWVCFPLTTKVNINAPVKPPAGTPGT